MTQAAKGPDTETIIELVDHVPLWALLVAAVVGGVVVFAFMISISKPPTEE